MITAVLTDGDMERERDGTIPESESSFWSNSLDYHVSVFIGEGSNLVRLGRSQNWALLSNFR